MAKTGELKEMWDMAAKTNLQFNMVRVTFLAQGHLLPVVHVAQHAPAVMKALKPTLVVQITFIGCCILLTIVALTYLFARSKPVYLIDYHCYKPPDR